MNSDLYETQFLSYCYKTVTLDPTPFLTPLINRLPKNSKILDIGCGSGRDLLWLKNQGYQPTGFERSSGIAQFAREHSQCSVIEGDFQTYDFSTLQFDAVIAIGAFVHLKKSELGPTLLRISRSINKDGLIYLTLKEGLGQYQNEDGRIFVYWEQEDLEETFETCGFALISLLRNVSIMNHKEIWLGCFIQYQGFK